MTKKDITHWYHRNSIYGHVNGYGVMFDEQLTMASAFVIPLPLH